jgi:hypothetical protein
LKPRFWAMAGRTEPQPRNSSHFHVTTGTKQAAGNAHKSSWVRCRHLCRLPLHEHVLQRRRAAVFLVRRHLPRVNKQTREHANTRARKHASTRAREHANTRTREHASTQTREHASTQTREHANTRARDHANTMSGSAPPSHPLPSPLLLELAFVWSTLKGFLGAVTRDASCWLLVLLSSKSLAASLNFPRVQETCG